MIDSLKGMVNFSYEYFLSKKSKPESKEYSTTKDKKNYHEEYFEEINEELARDWKELYAFNKGEIRSKADFERKKKKIEEMNRRRRYKRMSFIFFKYEL